MEVRRDNPSRLGAYIATSVLAQDMFRLRKMVMDQWSVLQKDQASDDASERYG
jgi:hypothetical protein